MPNSIESRLAVLETELRHAIRAVETFAPTAGQVIRAAAEVEDLRGDFGRMEKQLGDLRLAVIDDIGKVAKSCQEIKEDFKQANRERAASRRAIVLATIAASATVLAAIIAALATIAGG